jgi:hypothetical protein
MHAEKPESAPESRSRISTMLFDIDRLSRSCHNPGESGIRAPTLDLNLLGSIRASSTRARSSKPSSIMNLNFFSGVLMLGKSMLLILLIMMMSAIAFADDVPLITTAINTAYAGGYSNSGQTGPISSATPGAGQQSPDSLATFREFYEPDQGTQGSSPVQSGPVQFDLNGNEPTFGYKRPVEAL